MEISLDEFIKLNEDEVYIILDEMRRYGGSFVKGLAELYYLADEINKKKLKYTFYKYFIEYYVQYINENNKIN